MKTRDTKNITICIPAYLEPKLLYTLKSLNKAESEGIEIKVLVLINNSENADYLQKLQNLQYFNDAKDWLNSYNGNLYFQILLNQKLPHKYAGLGLARKILGDKAAADFKVQNLNGIIVYLDADCIVSENYFQVISVYFETSSFNAASIRFEHQVSDLKINTGIIEYESHLRYYILMQRYIGLPFATHTVGSSMAVLSDSYSSKGGMNKRKAGEDFYFLQKYIKDDECGILTECCVYPSGRISERVPFGTGRAMLNYEANNTFTWQTYNPKSFVILQLLIVNLEKVYITTFDLNRLNAQLRAFLDAIDFDKNLEQIRQNTTTYAAFKKRFFQYFDAFRLMKYLHYMRDEGGINDIPIIEGLKWYFENVPKENHILNPMESLRRLREIDNTYGN